MSKYIIETILGAGGEGDTTNEFLTVRGAHHTVLDVVFRRFFNDFCVAAISTRVEAVDFDTSLFSELVEPPTRAVFCGGGRGAGSELEVSKKVATSAASGGGAGVGGFFSSLGKLLSSPQDPPLNNDVSSTFPTSDKRRGGESFPIHVLQSYCIPEKEEVNTWTTFYPLDIEIVLLLEALKSCLGHKQTNRARFIVSDALTRSIFSCLLCVSSPWRVHELPAAKKPFGR